MYLQSKLNSGFAILFSFFIFFHITNASTNEKDYFLTLKNNKVNVRQGPSFDYPIKFIIKKKYLPVKIIDSYDNFKKVIDINNNSGWIHVSQLFKKKSAINIKNNSLILSQPKIYSKPIAKLEKGRLVLIKKCKEIWCKVNADNFLGWIKKENLWGKIR